MRDRGAYQEAQPQRCEYVREILLHGVSFTGFDFGMPPCVGYALRRARILEGLRELRPEKKYLRGIVNPYEEQHERGRSAVRRRLCLTTQVPSERKPTGRKQDSRKQSTSNRCLPCHWDV